MIEIRNVSLQALAVVSHHVFVPTSKLAFFHDPNLLVEAFPLLDIANVFGGYVNVYKQEVNLNALVTVMQFK